SCTHAVLSGNAPQRLQESVISKVITLDTLPIGSEKMIPKLTILPSAPLVGEAIKRIHLNESISTLFDEWR
ncbi:MAG TPA: ribose-phosphate diphosphokinase, partial [Fimbriimonadaceae bacterium]|nr:ribose-phosphate diphosphokinase [Fimbriimonadaceae bacterium]